MDAACNSRDLAADLLKLFFELTGQEQTRLADAVAQENSAAASAVAHKIAGSCAACGMSGPAARFRELEQLCKQAIPADVSDRLQAIDREMQETRLDLEKYFNCSFVSFATP
jgi:HPt (histidine-containing phosphotransfer) domain-containing protein